MRDDGLDDETFGTGNSEWKPEGYNMYSVPQEPYEMPVENTYNYTAPNEPYSTNFQGDQEQKKEGKALEVCALVFGILGIVGCMCCGIPGIVGLILSIVCLAKGKKSGMSIAGLICSILGLLLAIVFFAYVVFTGEFSSEFYGMDDPISGFDEPSTQDTDDDNNLHSAKDTTDNTEDPDTEEEDDSNSGGTNVADDISCAQVVLDGKTYTLPFRYADIKDQVTIDESDIEYYEDGIEPDDYAFLNMTEDGERNGVSISLINDTNKTMKNFDDATVMSVDESDYSGEMRTGKVTYMGGMKLGATAKELESFLEQFPDVYSSDSDNSYYYSFYIDTPDGSATCSYSFFVDKDTNTVNSISLDVYEN